jgi:hypothetical protein
MTPRRRIPTRSARRARAGILLARRHMTREPHRPVLRAVSGSDVASAIFGEAYLRTKLRLGALQRERAQIADLEREWPTP